MVKTAFLVACVIALPRAAVAENEVIGLLSLPEVFGHDACEKFKPEEIPLYAGPDARQRVASIRVDAYWTFHDVGGCEGLRVGVHSMSSRTVGELPTREYGYELPAAIVLEQRGRWFKVRLSDGAAWLQASPQDEYFPLEKLIATDLAYVTDASDGRLTASPGGGQDAGRAETNRTVRVQEFRRVGGRLWIRIEVLTHSICTSSDEPKVTARGWMPVHAASGEPTVWFPSRGC